MAEAMNPSLESSAKLEQLCEEGERQLPIDTDGL